jgi:hypothetical protein
MRSMTRLIIPAANPSPKAGQLPAAIQTSTSTAAESLLLAESREVIVIFINLYHLLERILTVPLRDWPSLTAASSSASFLALL